MDLEKNFFESEISCNTTVRLDDFWSLATSCSDISAFSISMRISATRLRRNHSNRVSFEELRLLQDYDTPNVNETFRV